MHNNFYFLRQLIPVLEQSLLHSRLVDCFAQEKNEIIFHFIAGTQSHFIKAAFHPDISCLSFPESFARARKNSVDLFGPLLGHEVTGMKQYENERSFSMYFTGDLMLLFKLHGNRGNLVLFRSSSPIELFRKKMNADLNLNPGQMDRSIPWTKEAFMAHLHSLKKLYFTFGKIPWLYLAAHDFDNSAPEKQWALIQQVKAELETGRMYLTRLDDLPVLSMLRVGRVDQEYENPLLALNDFYGAFSRENAFRTEKARAVSLLTNRITNIELTLQKVRERLHALEHEHHYRRWGDLIMAHLGDIRPGQSMAKFNDFDDPGKMVEVKLNTTMTPQKNAEKYYQKAKKQGVEIVHLTRTVNEKTSQLIQLDRILRDVGQEVDLSSLRKIAKEIGDNEKGPSGEPSHPFHSFSYNGYTIMIGKNARQNDELTLKVAHKEDLWLHVKDVPGSHVIVRHRPGQAFPKDVIGKAAQWAAYFSKRKTETLCPVVYCLKKFVRKRKGDPAGAMVVERETVILVSPEAPS